MKHSVWLLGKMAGWRIEALATHTEGTDWVSDFPEVGATEATLGVPWGCSPYGVQVSSHFLSPLAILFLKLGIRVRKLAHSGGDWGTH